MVSTFRSSWWVRGPNAHGWIGIARPTSRLLGTVTDAELRWLYANCTGVVAASHEDYGLTPLEALSFGRPAAVLRYGGFLDTVREGETGVFFDRADPGEIAAAVTTLATTAWQADVLAAAFRPYRQKTFVTRLREVVADLAG